jgi:tRNA1(Val) A37 N6-methylase TrmN6
MSTDTTIDAFLGGQLQIAQPAHGYRAGLDAVMLAAAVPARRGASHVLDVGAGVGTAGLCVAWRLPGVSVTLVEVQPELAGLAADNITRNALAARARIITADINAPAEQLRASGLEPDSFDHVVTNPPFDIEGRGRAPPNTLKARSHAMPAGALDHWARVLARYCRSGGTVTMIHRADALADVLACLDSRFGALHVLPIHPRDGAPATRIIVQGIKGSRAPLTLLPGLALHPADGSGFTGAVQAILRDGGELVW